MHITEIPTLLSIAKEDVMNWTNIAGYIHNHSPEAFLDKLGTKSTLKTLRDYQFLSYDNASLEQIHAYITSLKHTPQSQILFAVKEIIRAEISLQGYCHQIMHGKWNGRTHELIKTAHNIEHFSRTRLNANITLYDALHDTIAQGGVRPSTSKMGFEIANEMDLEESLTPRFSRGVLPIINLLDMLANVCAWQGNLVTRHLQNAERLAAGYVHLCREGLADIQDTRNENLKQNLFLSVKLAADTLKSMEDANPARYQDDTPIMHKGQAHHARMVLN